MNNKRTHINIYLEIQEMTGFLYIEEMPVDLNGGFKLNLFNSS